LGARFTSVLLIAWRLNSDLLRGRCAGNGGGLVTNVRAWREGDA
jgi:hypothetical protein